MAEDRAYAAAGVDLAARQKWAKGLPAILAQARRPEVLSDAGPFSGLFRLGEGYRDAVLAASADGVGTKVKLHAAAGRLDLCGPDILGHSVNDIMNDYVALDPVAAMGSYFASVRPLLDAITCQAASIASTRRPGTRPCWRTAWPGPTV